LICDCIWSDVIDRQPDNLFFKTHQLHLHVPEGAIEKDGPSAGIAMASSIIR
jgi:ATP-dependent Lon protease